VAPPDRPPEGQRHSAEGIYVTNIPEGYGATFDVASAPLWLRVWFTTPFVDRFAYPLLVKRGFGISGGMTSCTRFQCRCPAAGSCESPATSRRTPTSPTGQSTKRIAERRRLRRRKGLCPKAAHLGTDAPEHTRCVRRRWVTPPPVAVPGLADGPRGSSQAAGTNPVEVWTRPGLGRTPSRTRQPQSGLPWSGFAPVIDGSAAATAGGHRSR
jgi:hypothetical protein